MLDTKRLHRLALRLAYKNGQHECPEQLAQDLEQAAWVKYLTLESYAHLWGDLYYAMLEELSRWLWQCKRGRGKDRLLTAKVELHEWTRKTLGTLDPEKILIAKESVRREQQLAYKRDYYLEYNRWIRRGKTGPDPRVNRPRLGREGILKNKAAAERRRREVLRAGRQVLPRGVQLIQKYGVKVVKKALKCPL